MVPAFDVLRGVVSIHQPIFRILAGLFAVDRFYFNLEYEVCYCFLYSEYLRFFDPKVGCKEEIESFIVSKVNELGTDLYEMSLR